MSGHVCKWCKVSVSSSSFVHALGDKSGPKIYGCSKHLPRIELTKAIVGSSALVGFQVGMDRAFPGVREKIGQIGGIAMSIFNDATKKTEEPAE